MGLAASQARFLQLTARKNDIEYEAQQISFQRLQLSDELEAASMIYNKKTSNRKMIFKYNTGNEVKNVDVSYQNYKNYMNQQLEGLSTTQDKYYLVSSSGNKIVVANNEERDEMIARTTSAKATTNSTGDVEYSSVKILSPEDFIIVDNLDDYDLFQQSIQNGDYYFARMNEVQYDDSDNPIVSFTTESWDSLGGGVIQEVYDTTDDAQAEAEYQSAQAKIQRNDKMLEMRLNELETDRSAIETEIESISKVMEDNIEASFKTFG